MSGRVVHFEVPFDDGDRARKFYAETFEWQLNEMPEMNYTLVTTGPSADGPPSEPGFINGGMMQRDAPFGAPVIVIDVEDIDMTLETVERLGGTTVTAKQSVGDMGYAAYFKDPEGNLIGLWQNA
jgi:predicted enzyme related to lactoylglutathione lyase